MVWRVLSQVPAHRRTIECCIRAHLDSLACIGISHEGNRLQCWARWWAGIIAPVPSFPCYFRRSMRVVVVRPTMVDGTVHSPKRRARRSQGPRSTSTVVSRPDDNASKSPPGSRGPEKRNDRHLISTSPFLPKFPITSRRKKHHIRITRRCCLPLKDLSPVRPTPQPVFTHTLPPFCSKSSHNRYVLATLLPEHSGVQKPIYMAETRRALYMPTILQKSSRSNAGDSRLDIPHALTHIHLHTYTHTYNIKVTSTRPNGNVISISLCCF